MLRSILPFIFAILGITIAAFATSMPLFEWHISEADTDLPLEAQVGLSSLTTKLGDSLNDRFYINNGFSITDASCSPETLGITFKRSEKDLTTERAAIAVEEAITPWMFDAALRTLIPLVCMIYIWLFTILYKRPIGEAVAFSTIAVMLFCFLIDIWKILLYKVGSTFGSPCPGLLASYPAILNQVLSKIHYETWLVFSVGILLGLGAFGEMLLQILGAVFRRKAPAESVVG